MADTKVLVAPSLQAGYRQDSGSKAVPQSADNQYAWAGLELALSNVPIAQSLLAKAEAQCRLEAAREGLLEIADELTAASRAVAYSKKAEALAAQVAPARKVQASLASAVKHGAATIEEKLSVDRLVLDIVNAEAEARRVAGVERAKLNSRPKAAFARLLTEYVDAQGDSARADNALRRARAFSLAIYAQWSPNNALGALDPVTGEPDGSDFRFGIRGSYSLGSLLIGGEERMIVAANRQYAATHGRGAPQAFLTLSRVIAAERTGLQDAVVQIRSERSKTASKIRELESVRSERSRRIADATRLRIMLLDAEISYLDTLDAEYARLSAILLDAQNG
jgi:hypothetical protein